MVFEVRLIKDEDVLHRRIPPNYFKTNGPISSSAYKVNGRPDVEISVDLAYLTTIEKTLEDRPHFGVGSLIALDPRSLGLGVVHDPLPDNEAHSLIKGATENAQCSELARRTKIVKRPT